MAWHAERDRVIRIWPRYIENACGAESLQRLMIDGMDVRAEPLEVDPVQGPISGL